MKKIFVFYGSKGSGKDTCSGFLEESNNATKLSFAEKVREIAWLMYKPKLKYKHRLWGNINEKEELIEGWEISNDFKEKFGFSENLWSGRRILQWLGTEVGRGAYDNVWIDLLEDELINCDNDLICITDCRFFNEYNKLKSLDKEKFKTTFVKVTRGSVSDNNFSTHASERDMKDFGYDYHIKNDNTLERLKEEVFNIFKK